MTTSEIDMNIIRQRIINVLNYHKSEGKAFININSIPFDYDCTGDTTLSQDCKHLSQISLVSLLTNLNFDVSATNTISTNTNEIIRQNFKNFDKPKFIDNYDINSNQRNIFSSSNGLPFSPIPNEVRMNNITFKKEKKNKLKPNYNEISNEIPQNINNKIFNSNSILDLQKNQTCLEKTNNLKSYSNSNVNDEFYHIVKSITFDHMTMKWKVALERPYTLDDKEFFSFCTHSKNAINEYLTISKDLISKGKCYFIKYNNMYYRAIYIEESFPDQGIFEFVDFEIVRTIKLNRIRIFPNIKQVKIPYLIDWIFCSDISDIKQNDKVYCSFHKTFKEINFRKVYNAEIKKIR